MIQVSIVSEQWWWGPLEDAKNICLNVGDEEEEADEEKLGNPCDKLVSDDEVRLNLEYTVTLREHI